MSRSIVAITGASGFLGRALVARALAAGRKVRGLDLAPDHAGSPSIERLRGDVSDPAACAALCAGAETVYHTAAVVRESGPMALFERVNVGGTGAMLIAARRAGVRHFVMISSVMVHGFDFPDGVPEDGPLGGFDNPYCATKIRSEALALAAHEPGVFDVYVVRPGDVYGPGSIPWTERPTRMMAARSWIYVDSKVCHVNHVYVDNLLDAIDLVLAANKGGLPFTVTDDRRTTAREFFSHYQRFLGIRALPDLPGPLVLRAAATLDRAASVLGRELEMNREAVRYVLRRGQYGIDRIKALGYTPRIGLDEGMARSVAWLREKGIGR
ncbi:NAD-dependent epimerase/dehydratase family protein [Polyangium sorediatum]|uniref:NAD-dependent epimerase/dehydratase family protein n=1 Tax=Polyangium sorediatum TaxID=889274 RepID=A0ABT6NNE3_9BACT|nr:NAD-dependent epimerase/dehydratase family protein [Polyangium sorediatum]MDI1429852.1 NAD-dependent epimerase/dehydratase family protein [Polyangium sorediatum]